jgi:hypothetical protein
VLFQALEHQWGEGSALLTLALLTSFQNTEKHFLNTSGPTLLSRHSLGDGGWKSASGFFQCLELSGLFISSPFEKTSISGNKKGLSECSTPKNPITNGFLYENPWLSGGLFEHVKKQAELIAQIAK